MIQRISSTIAAASEKIAKGKNLDYLMNREACFYIRPDLDVTDLVILEMDKSFDSETSKADQISNYDDDSLDGVDDLTLPQAG